MKTRLSPMLLTALLLLMVCLLVIVTRQICPTCGRPVYFYLLRFCSC